MISPGSHLILAARPHLSTAFLRDSDVRKYHVAEPVRRTGRGWLSISRAKLQTAAGGSEAHALARAQPYTGLLPSCLHLLQQLSKTPD